MPITRRQFVPLAAAALLAPWTRGARAQQSLPLAGIAYAAIRVKDLAAARSFYLGLGFEEQPAKSTAGAASVAFLKINDRQYLRLHASSPGETAGFLGLGFETADLEAAHEELASHGLKPAEILKSPDSDPSFLLEMPAPAALAGPATPQRIEYLQYAPDSALSAGFGQHLGPDRIADRLLAVSVPCAVPEDAREFYLNDLNFRQLPGSPMLLHLPGGSGQYVAIVPGPVQGAKARLVLETATLGRAERHLHREHIAFSRAATNKDGGTEVFSFQDPDGNLLLIQQR